MARGVNHHLRCEHLEERATPSDVGCAAGPVEGAATAEAEGIATGDTITAELPESPSGVLGGHRVQMDEEGTVVAVMPEDAPAVAKPVVVEADEIPLTTTAIEFNFADVIVRDLFLDETDKLVPKPKFIHPETHPAGRPITEGALTWGVDALLTVDSVDVVKLILGSMGEAAQAA